MVSDSSVAERAKKIYEQSLKASLEVDHQDKFVAIEPESGDFFLGLTLSEAIGKARSKYPDKLAHALRVGHRAAVHFGMHIR
jgi:hypothetical protein